MPKCFRYTPVFLLLSFWAQALYGQQPEQDCFTAINVCTSNYSQNSANSGFGSVLDIAPNATCIDNGEANSSWFLFRVVNSGSFTFEIVPNNVNDDYDFVLFDLTGDSCTSIADGSLSSIRCNYSSTPGNTGLETGATGTQEPTAGPNQCSPMNVNIGEVYALLVNNFTGSTNGYVLSLGGSASVFDNITPHVDTVKHGTVCNPKTISIYFNEPVLCSSISSDLSETTITGPSNPVVASFTAVGCNINGMTNRINITFTANINMIGNYTLNFQNGADGNTFEDGCGNFLSSSYSYTFPVEHIGPTITLDSYSNTDCTIDNGSIDIAVAGGQAPYSYSWNTVPVQTTQDISNLSNGYYTVVVTDDIGCTATYSRSIIDINAPTLSLAQNIPISCNGLNDGTATVAAAVGTPPYTYSWDTSPVQVGPTANNLSPGVHVVTVIDSQGCSRYTNVTTAEPDALSIQLNKTNTTCGNSVGSIVAVVSGGTLPYSYVWNTNPVQNTPTITSLPVGIYTLSVSDSNNCSATSTTTIASATAQLATIQNVRPTCDEPTGRATAVVNGNNPPYTFQWNTVPAQTTATATNLGPGAYFVIITGGDNCSQILNVKIDTATDVQGNLVSVLDASCGVSDGSATVEGLVGEPPYSYQWITNPSQNGATATNLAGGNYDVIIEDANGCDDTITVAIGELVGTANFTWSQTCFGYPTQFQAQSNLDSVAFVWDFGDTASTPPSLDTGQSVEYTFPTQDSFTVTLISSGGCIQDTLTQTYAVNALPLPSFSTGSQNLYTENTYNFDYTGTPAISYFWELGNGQTSNAASPYVSYLDSGIHQITLAVVDSNGCTDTIQTDLFVAKKPNIYMPNAFVPVTQGKNPIYKVYGYDVAEIDFRVFSRWGNVVYSTQSPNDALTIGWDGTFLGIPLPQGVYGYKIWVKFVDEREFEKTGTITLVR